MIVFDLLEAVQDGNAVTEGARKVVGVMHKDARKFEATGGWGFEGFGGGDPTKRVVGNNAASACFACHQPQKARTTPSAGCATEGAAVDQPALAPPWRTSEWLNTPTPMDLGAQRGRVVVACAFQMLCPGCVGHAIPQLNAVYDRVTPLCTSTEFAARWTSLRLDCKRNVVPRARRKSGPHE